MLKLHGYAFTLIILHCLIQWVDCTCDVAPANSPLEPHGCYNYGLCTKPYMRLVSILSLTYRWACTTPNDCVCVNGTSNGTYACLRIDNQCANSPCGTDPNQHFVCTTSGIDSYTCTCAAGYTGTNCDAAINSACAMALDPCINGGACHDDTSGGFNCSCPDGYSGARCQYYDFCGKNTTLCQNYGQCENLFNGTDFICKCTKPNTQGRYCELINTNHEDMQGQKCYDFDHKELDDTSKYPYSFYDEYMTHDKCRDRMFSSISVVFKTYTISGRRCYLSNDTYLKTEIKPSGLLGLVDDAYCQTACKGNNAQQCGWWEERAIVVTYNIVEPDDNPCEDNATLCGDPSSQGVCVNLLSTTVIDTTTGYFCICAPEYTGPNCEQSMADPCSSMPCENNGTCIPDTVLHTYTCNCTIDYYGDNCEFEKKCTASTCLYGGTCIENDDGTTSCECLTYYHGDYCEVVNRCEYGNPCYNGTCNSTLNCIDPTAYTCTCNDGYIGVHCEIETNECIPDNCQNFATCVDLFLDYKCLCLNGTSGKDCDINEDDCKDSPCNTKDDNAVCIDQIGGYTCNCSSQWMGEKCDMNVIIRNVLLAIYGEIRLEMVSMLEDLMKQPVLIKDMVPYILGMKTYEERLNLSWTADDLFDWIAYEEEELDPHLDLYIFNDIVLGNCFSFNKILNANYSYNVRDGGTNNGLRAKIRMRQDEYVPWTDTAAILSFVASGTDYIFAESVRYNAEPGGVTIFDVADTRYQRLGGKYGTCIKESKEVPYYYYPGTYSADVRNRVNIFYRINILFWGCLRSCYQKMINESIGCFDPRYPFPEGGIPCALSERSTVEAAASENGDPSTWGWCICPPACSNQLYQVAWTRTEYAQFPPECPEHDDISCVKKEMDTVHIITRMIPLEYSLFQEIPAMDLNKFISNLGGLLGVLMGISIISFIEVFFLAFRLISIIISGKNI